MVKHILRSLSMSNKDGDDARVILNNTNIVNDITLQLNVFFVRNKTKRMKIINWKIEIFVLSYLLINKNEILFL